MTQPDSVPEAGAQAAIPLLGLAASLGLLALHQGYFPWRMNPAALALAYTLAVAPPLCAALLLRRAAERHAWACAVGVGGLLGALAWHEGSTLLAQVPGATAIQPLEWGYLWTHGIALFIALAFLAVVRPQRGPQRWRPDYGAVYAAAWDHALALAVALVFTAMGWLLLWLWSGLFKLIGIPLFDEVFFDAFFAHPATGLLFGLGLTLGRTQAGVAQALLRVCLALGTVLLPLIALVGLSFAVALPFTGLEGLWNTRRAAALLVTLVLATVVLTNAVFQDGAQGEPPYPRWMRLVVNGALAVLPVFAALAGLALSLRVRQYGWTVDRLFGALGIGTALLYAFGYALALIVRRGPWLSLAAPVNVATALTLMLALLLSYAPWTDFRIHAARSQLEQALRDPAKADIEYLRWQLGQPGVAALRALQTDPALAAHPDVRAAIGAQLAQQTRWTAQVPNLPDLPARLAVYPHGAAVPETLWPALLAGIPEHEKQQLGNCTPAVCALLGVDLDTDGQPEWMLLTGSVAYLTQSVLALTPAGWQVVGNVPRNDTTESWAATRAALAAGTWQTHPPRYQNLRIGKRRYVVAPRPGDAAGE